MDRDDGMLPDLTSEALARVLTDEADARAELARLREIIDRAAGELGLVNLEPGWKVSDAHVKVLRQVRRCLAVLAEAR